MITPEEFSKLELLFEKLKLLIISDIGDKFYHTNQLIVQMLFLKNEGNKIATAKELGINVKTLRTYLKEITIDGDLLDMHLNRLAADGWINELPIEEQLAHIAIVEETYSINEVEELQFN